jgi:AraC-like DNA-binding protein
MLTTLRWEGFFGEFEGPTLFRVLANGDLEAHDHDFMELVVILDGEGIHESPLGETPLSAGTALLIRPNNWHNYVRCNNLELVNFCFPVAVVRSEWRNLLDERVRSLLRSGKGLQFAQLPAETIHSIQVIEQTPRSSCGALGLVVWALDQFAMAIPESPNPIHPAVERALCALENEPQSPWTARDLAKEVGLDRAYLSRLFKTQVGIGPMGYVNQLRLEQAASLLRHSDLNCTEVGLAVGYTDPSLFSRRFRTKFGLSPASFRIRSKLNDVRPS